jgi:hypothetical protein
MHAQDQRCDFFNEKIGVVISAQNYEVIGVYAGVTDNE